MEAILRLLRTRTQCDYVTLHVKSINTAALGFYHRMGFTTDPHDGFLANHYYIDGKRWDAYRYTKALRHPMVTFMRDLCPIL